MPTEPQSPEPQPEPPQESSTSTIMAWVPLAATLVLMPALAYAMTEFVLVPRLRSSLGLTEKTSPTSQPSGDKKGAIRENVPMTKLLVNVAGTMGARYLLVSLTVSGSSPEFKTKLQTHDPQLRDLACGILATKTLADLEKPGARNLIRSELISGFNNLLGTALVEEIFLTEFAVQ